MDGTLNKVILIGYLGDEVKIHYFEEGNSIGRFPLATREFYTNKEGEKISNTEWHSIVVKNKLAEICEKYLSKGSKIYCEGRIKKRRWEDGGIKKHTTEISVYEVVFLDKKTSQVKDSEEDSDKE